MALEKAYNLGGGVELPSAYHRIEELHLATPLGYSEGVVAFVGVYKDKAARDDGALQPVTRRQYVLQFPGSKTGNIYQQVYNLLKQEEDYADAIDA